MAKAIIGSDIISKDLVKQLNELIKSIEGAEKGAIDLEKEVAKGVKTQRELGELLKKSNENSKKLTDTEKESIRVKQQIAKEITAINKAQTEEGKKIVELRQKKLELNKATKDEIRQRQLGIKSLAIIKGSYDQIKFALAKNQQSYRALTTEEQKNDAVGKKLVATIKAQKKELDDLDDKLKDPPKKFAALRSSVTSLVAGFGIVAGIQMFTRALKNAFNTVQRFDKAQSDLAAVLGKTKGDIAALTADA
ncbi:MAG: hypothetical protein GY797_30920, partial [Deltaproteobacteria bacterium]|nr:hypothetical protein [Deltaproteobacteria bacterium]